MSNDAVLLHPDRVSIPSLSKLDQDPSSLGVVSYNNEGDLYPISYTQLSEMITIDPDDVCSIVSNEPCIYNVANSMFSNTTITEGTAFIEAVNSTLTDIQVDSVTIDNKWTLDTTGNDLSITGPTGGNVAIPSITDGQGPVPSIIVGSTDGGVLGSIAIGEGLNMIGNTMYVTGGRVLPSATTYGQYIYYNGTDWIVGGNKVSIGNNAGLISQSGGAIAIGRDAGHGNGDSSITTGQGDNAIAIGNSAGRNSQGANAISIGTNAGYTRQSSDTIAIGNGAASGIDSLDTIDRQESGAIAMGRRTGCNNQGGFSIAIGAEAARRSQSTYSIAIGSAAGQYYQQSYAIAIGHNAGYGVGDYDKAKGQQTRALAVGYRAGMYFQGEDTVAVGNSAGCGEDNNAFGQQQNYAVAVGAHAGRLHQGKYAIAVGAEAARTKQGEYAIAIGYGAGYSEQKKKSIIINASGEITNNLLESSCVIRPIRGAPNPEGGPLNHLWYNTITYEVCYHTSTSP